jgi:two-component system KDP operon response regulator KdpE
MNVLTIGDTDLRLVLKLALERKGLRVFCAHTVVESMEALKRIDVRVVILDMDFKGGENLSISICRQIRTVSNIPILMTSDPSTDKTQIISGLSNGADHYLPKPIDVDILFAEIQALLRRVGQTMFPQHPFYIDAQLTIDIHRQVVFVGEKRVSLSPLEFGLLEILVCNGGQIVPSIEIIELLWPNREYDEQRHLLHVYIARLRKLIEPVPQQPRYILNEHGLGYVFNSGRC